MQFAGVSRFVYNLALEQRMDWWRQFKAKTGRRINWASQSLEVTELRRDLPWLMEAPRCICEQSLRDLEKAFVAFFTGKAGYPKFRTRDKQTAFRVAGAQVRMTRLNSKWAFLKIPNCEPIKIRLTRPIQGDLKNAALRFDGSCWYVSIATEIQHDVAPVGGRVVGVDRGVANTISLSSGEHFALPNIDRLIAARKRAQRTVARRKKGSVRRHAAKRSVAQNAARIANIRKHELHRYSSAIAHRFDFVALEKLNVKNMTASAACTIEEPGRNVRQKAGLNRSILEQGWSIFAEMLEYKLAERGGQVEYVNPAYTSQTCSDCGSVSADNRKSQAVFECIDCGHRAHADTNAAINILRRSPAWQRVEGSSCRPVEA